MPGDELVSQCQFVCTRAVSIAAPREQVWPWLVQIGFGRAGFYSYDLLDNRGRPSAERILKEFQGAAVGDLIPMSRTINDTTAFRIAVIEPPETLVWSKPDSVWAWRLTETAGETHLVTRLHARYGGKGSIGALLTAVLMEFADYPMMRKMLLGIKRRAEAGVDLSSR